MKEIAKERAAEEAKAEAKAKTGAEAKVGIKAEAELPDKQSPWQAGEDLDDCYEDLAPPWRPGSPGFPRRRAREVALLMLYQLDFGGNEPEMAARTLADIGLDEEGSAFACGLVEQARAYRASADALISSLSREWDFARLFSIDVTILRLALSELESETPANIVINEAIELAKKFGEATSPSFVNAVLDAVYQQKQGGGAS